MAPPFDVQWPAAEAQYKLDLAAAERNGTKLSTIGGAQLCLRRKIAKELLDVADDDLLNDVQAGIEEDLERQKQEVNLLTSLG